MISAMLKTLLGGPQAKNQSPEEVIPDGRIHDWNSMVVPNSLATHGTRSSTPITEQSTQHAAASDTGLPAHIFFAFMVPD